MRRVEVEVARVPLIVEAEDRLGLGDWAAGAHWTTLYGRRDHTTEAAIYNNIYTRIEPKFDE